MANVSRWSSEGIVLKTQIEMFPMVDPNPPASRKKFNLGKVEVIDTPKTRRNRYGYDSQIGYPQSRYTCRRRSDYMNSEYLSRQSWFAGTTDPNQIRLCAAEEEEDTLLDRAEALITGRPPKKKDKLDETKIPMHNLDYAQQKIAALKQLYIINRNTKVGLDHEYGK